MDNEKSICNVLLEGLSHAHCQGGTQGQIPVLMIMTNNENGFSGGDLKEKALSAIITKTDTDWS